MSDLPKIEEPAGPDDLQVPPPEPPSLVVPQTWFQRLTSILFILFCFELGLFLLIYPWTDGWSDNYFAWIISGKLLHGHAQSSWHNTWNNSYVRGGLSGIGVVNLWIALMEVFHLFARRHADSK